ncbi:MAG: tRNA epoxyqueuosine(34) reductase QueG [Alistipes sp.]|nr:tRNA epoxyqueuosine(34) reductase QueG [Alistipes sp.]
MLKLNDIKRLAREVGFDLCGVAQCRDLERDRAFLEGWLERGFGGSLDYLKKNIAVRADATSLVEGAKTVIVCALAYKNEISNGYSCKSRGKVASYALTTDYHRTIKDMLFELCRRLKAHDDSFAARCFVDSAPIFEKRYAVEAGLGWIGRQSLLITPDYGSFVLLGEVVTSAECDSYDTPLDTVGCGECRRCVEACPNGAIKERHIDTTRCISCATIERRGEGEQCPLHGWIFGCDECQSVCPYNRKAPCATSPQVIPIFNPIEMTAEEWLSLSDEEFASRFGSTPMQRAGLERLKENLERSK